MSKNWYVDIVASEDGARLYQQEKVILDVTELVCDIMEEEGVSRTELAQRLKTSKPHVSQLLNGSANITLRTLSDIFYALGRQPTFGEIRKDGRADELAVKWSEHCYRFDRPNWSIEESVVSLKDAPRSDASLAG